MKFRRVQFPGQSLIVAGIQAEYSVFCGYFFKLWLSRFGARPLAAGLPGPESATRSVFAPLVETVELPKTFFGLWRFLLAHRIKTVVLLNPDLRAGRALRWAAFFAGVKNRVGFAPLRQITALNLSLPFNNENHHYVHQLKNFFEYITGEKTTGWNAPELPPAHPVKAPPLPESDFGIIAFNTEDALAQYLKPQLQKLTNLMTRSQHCVLVLRGRSLQSVARSFSEVMTERAIERTLLMLAPSDEELRAAMAQAGWITGADTELLNLAALMALPSLAVFGPLNERLWQPFSVRTRALTGDFACRPCSAYPGQVSCTHEIPWACVAGASAELMAATLTGMMRRKNQPG